MANIEPSVTHRGDTLSKPIVALSVVALIAGHIGFFLSYPYLGDKAFGILGLGDLLAVALLLKKGYAVTPYNKGMWQRNVKAGAQPETESLSKLPYWIAGIVCILGAQIGSYLAYSHIGNWALAPLCAGNVLGVLLLLRNPGLIPIEPPEKHYNKAYSYHKGGTKVYLDADLFGLINDDDITRAFPSKNIKWGTPSNGLQCLLGDGANPATADEIINFLDEMRRTKGSDSRTY